MNDWAEKLTISIVLASVTVVSMALIWSRHTITLMAIQ